MYYLCAKHCKSEIGGGVEQGADIALEAFEYCAGVLRVSMVPILVNFIFIRVLKNAAPLQPPKKVI